MASQKHWRPTVWASNATNKPFLNKQCQWKRFGGVLPLLPQSLLLLRAQTPTQPVTDGGDWQHGKQTDSTLDESPGGRGGWLTYGENCCAYVGVGDDGEVWSGGLSRLGTTKSWRSRSPSSAPWSSAGHGGRTECRASTVVFRPPVGDGRWWWSESHDQWLTCL